ncbi:MAG: hypothetical protein HY553_02175, partial [Elusimicrobia bacterium]|nr:hypothetical protein [Elusimicrobiota bacterium]
MMPREAARRGTAALISAALLLTSPGTGAYRAFAQDVVHLPQGIAVQGIGSAGAAGAAGIAPAAAPLPIAGPSGVGAPLTLPVSRTLAPAARRGHAPAAPIQQAVTAAGGRATAATAGAAATVAGSRSRGGAAAAELAAAEGGRFTQAVAARTADTRRPAFGLFRLLGEGAVGTGAAEAKLKPSGRTLADPDRARSWSERIFSFAKDAAPAAEPSDSEVEGRAGEPRPSELAPAAPENEGAETKPVESTPVASPAPAKTKLGWKKALGLGATIVLGVAGFVKLLDAPVLQHPMLDALGIFGMWSGNILAVAYPIAEIYKTFRQGDAKSLPVSGAVAGSAAPLVQGVVSAPIKAQPVWGLQNLFGAVTTFAPLALNRHLKGPVSVKEAVWKTALTSAVAAAISWGLWVAAKAVVPGFVTGLLGAGGVSALLLGIQAAAFLGFVYIFIPTIKDLLQGRAPRAFSPGFSLMFAGASAAFVAWMLQAAFAAPVGSADRLWSLIYAAQNVVLFAVSFVSYMYTRKTGDAPGRALGWVTPPVVPGGVYGAGIGAILGLMLAPYSPLVALAVPLFGWALGGTFKNGQIGPDVSEKGLGSFWGVGAGMLAAAALTAFGLPVYPLVALPFAGAVIGWRLGYKGEGAAPVTTGSAEPRVGAAEPR